MYITTNYQPNYYEKISNQQLHTNPTFGMAEKIIPVVAAPVLAGTILAIQNGVKKTNEQEFQTIYGPVRYTPSVNGEKQSLVVSRPNGMTLDVFKDIPKETLESPITEHLHQVKCHTINPDVGISLIQNQSNPVTARKVVVEGTLENSLVKNNITNIPAKYSSEQDSMFTDTPWFPGIQYANQKCFQVTYGTVREDWGARPEYIAEYADPATGEAPDVAILAAQKGTDDRSFVPADIAGKQYEIVTESGERIPCNYEDMDAGVDYKISKKAGVELKMAVPPTNVISSEGEDLPANQLYMVDSNGHFYNGNPIKRIKSGEVTWNADMSDPVQAQIRHSIDQSLSLEAETKALKKEAAALINQAEEIREKANKKRDARTLKDVRKNNTYAARLNKKADILTAKAEELKAQSKTTNDSAKTYTNNASKEMTEWVKVAQNRGNVNFFAEA